MVLEVHEIHTYYGQSHVLFGVSLDVAQGEVVCLLGRNGAGKTTTLRSIMGLTPPRSGRIRYKGGEILGLPPHQIARRGIGFVPEDRCIFPELTVWENLEVGRKNGRAREQQQLWTVERVFELFPQLRAFQNRLGGSLSGGEQQMLTIARTLVGNPELILLDEPSEGLAPVVVQALFDQLMNLKREGLSILLSEQNLGFATALGDRVYIIEKGEIRYRGTTAEILENEAVRTAYLTV